MSSPHLRIPRQSPTRRAGDVRNKDFDEIDKGFNANQAMKEALRCVQCHNPPCQLMGCPVSHHIPQWIDKIVDGKFQDAWRIISKRNNMPEACGKLCPQEVLCESHCVVRHVGEPVAIGKLEEFVARLARRNGWYQTGRDAPDSSKRVAIVGSGPAGLSAAEELLDRGHQVVIFERQKVPGGLMVYGIPNFKFAKNRMAELVERIKQKGGDFQTGKRVGSELSIDELAEEFDATLLAIGAEKGRALAISGADLKNIHIAGKFLNQANLDDEYLSGTECEIEVGKTCAVFGAGDTAMDCVRTAVRLGYEKVLCIYRRSEKEMTGRIEDRTCAHQEGVEFRYLEAPVRFLGDGKVQQVECVKMELGEPDDSGRCRPHAVEGSEFMLDVDTVVLALGYQMDSELPESAELKQTGWGIDVDGTYRTSRSGVYAAGDAVNGADLIVTAVRSGRGAARAIDNFLQK